MRLRVFLTVLISLAFKISFATTVPLSVEQFLKAKFPDLQLVSLKDYGASLQSFIEEGELPFYCSSDFDGDNHPDHAVLLKDGYGKIFLYAIFTEGENVYQSMLVDTFNKLYDEFQIIIRIEAKGEWESVTEKIYVPNDGISLELIEESLSWSYYFKNGHFEKFIYD